MDPKRQIKYNKAFEETCGLLMEISTIILMDFTQYLEKFASIQPPNKDLLGKSEVKDEESNFYFNIKLFSDITVYIKGCFEVYMILIKQLDDMILPYKTFLKLIQYLSRARLGLSNLTFTAKNAWQNYHLDQQYVNKYIKIILDINKEEDTKARENLMKKNDINITSTSIPIIPKPKKVIVSKLPKVTVVKGVIHHEDLSEKIRKQFMFRSNEDSQKIMRIKNALNK